MWIVDNVPTSAKVLRASHQNTTDNCNKADGLAPYTCDWVVFMLHFLLRLALQS